MARIKFKFRKSWTQAGIPLRENCDSLNPRQALLPAFTGFAMKGAPMLIPAEYWEELSEHIIEYLGIPVDESIQKDSTGRRYKARRLLEPIGQSLGWTPRRKYQPPATVMNRATAAGQWVTMDTPDPERKPLSQQYKEMAQPDRVAVKDAVFDALGITDEPQEPGPITVNRLALRMRLKPSQVVTLLKGWGMENATVGTQLNRNTALRIMAHYNRTRGYDIT